MLKKISLNDRYDLNLAQVLLSGTQALVRATLMQAAMDKQDNIDSAGFITGYRGSPLGGLDQQFQKVEQKLSAANIKFQAGLNEDSAATALWGTQQVNLRGEGKVDGVFGLWYGKGPGVDRSGDVFRHANLAGTAKNGGVLVATGDDHTGESSTTLHQSEFALMDAMMPILSPSGVQEILDFSLFGWALSRYAGVWVGLKCVKDTVEVTEVVDASLTGYNFLFPEVTKKTEGVHIRANDLPVDQEERLHKVKLPAIKEFVKINKIDKIGLKKTGAKIGIVSAGKSWLDTTHALNLLGVNEKLAKKLGLTSFKLGMVWPIEPDGFKKWAKGLKLIIVVEEKRKLIEGQVKEILFNLEDKPTVIGGVDEKGENLFQSHYSLDPLQIARKLGDKIVSSTGSEDIKDKLLDLQLLEKSDTNAPVPARTPYFCAGCPHNSSTKIPDGARAYAGIGCHYMVQWMDRNTEGYTHMGGEGANWIGESPFSNRGHIFQNIGDGTYNHSGLMSIRAAITSKVNITYKILFNDAVAMTGGQKNDGEISSLDIIKELKAIGVKQVIAVYDEKEVLDLQTIAKEVEILPRNELIRAQEKLALIPGVTAIVYIQTCAAEKRRRRKKAEFPDFDKKIFINTEVCEGCGDCGLQSNCVAILPHETVLGRKRKIDQSACNKDFSCTEGLCPSFVSVEGAVLKRKTKSDLTFPDMPHPELPAIKNTCNIVIAGVGGSGVVTIGALIAMAAYLEDKGASVMEMAGLAQKGGAVHIHCRIANEQSGISAVRISKGEADVLLGGELMVSAGEKTLSLIRRGRTKAVCSFLQTNAGEFTQDKDFSLPTEDMRLSISAKLGSDSVNFYDTVATSESIMGDAIYSNVLLLGCAWQHGLIPLSLRALKEAIRLNGANIESNWTAFSVGRLLACNAENITRFVKTGHEKPAQSLEEVIIDRKKRLTSFQNFKLAERYESLVKKATEKNVSFGLAVATGYYKILAYKDEYEVARLHSNYLERALESEFESFKKIGFYMAPPILFRKSSNGRQRKVHLGAWFLPILKFLARAKILRGTFFDIFGYTKERRAERQLIREYETDIEKLTLLYSDKTHELSKSRALLPLEIKGFGSVKEKAIADASELRNEIMIASSKLESAEEKLAAE